MCGVGSHSGHLDIDVSDRIGAFLDCAEEILERVFDPGSEAWLKEALSELARRHAEIPEEISEHYLLTEHFERICSFVLDLLADTGAAA